MKILPLLVFLGTMVVSTVASANALYLNQPLGSFNATVGTGAFEDYWTFNLGGINNINAQINNQNYTLSVPSGSFKIQDIQTLSLKLYSTVLGSSTFNPLNYSAVSGDLNPTTTGMTFNSLASGSYALKVSGIGDGLAGGRYSGSLAVAPVPEPETWILLMIGGVLLSLQLRRKNISQDPMFLSV
ncbi:FxDxF family PEP-CTERM protein [Methylobacter sp.]|uniref:FxDxF family PEP-CTERM protein n=1 Tax=Methylobacter sp. TaxID=2051955 RepID=UPI002FDC8C58